MLSDFILNMLFELLLETRLHHSLFPCLDWLEFPSFAALIQSTKRLQRAAAAAAAATETQKQQQQTRPGKWNDKIEPSRLEEKPIVSCSVAAAAAEGSKINIIPRSRIAAIL